MSDYIYRLIDPRTNETRYVGWTVNTGSRLWRHIDNAKKGDTTHRSNWIRQLLVEGLEPELKVIEVDPPDGWEQAEKDWIALFRESGSLLTNMTEGGNGFSSEYHQARWAKASPEERRASVQPMLDALTPEQRGINARRAWARKTPEEQAAFRESSRLVNLGRKHSEQARLNMSEAHKGLPSYWTGKTKPESTNQKIRETLKERAKTPERQAVYARAWEMRRKKYGPSGKSSS